MAKVARIARHIQESHSIENSMGNAQHTYFIPLTPKIRPGRVAQFE